ncbi:MAG: hypothetical protein ACLRMN_07300 [Mediterraneibacter gnavus]
MCALLHLLCDTTWLDAWFCCAKALVLAEFAASLHWQLYVWWTLTYGKLSPAFAVVTMTVLYTGIYVGYYFLERGHFPTDERLQINGKELLSAVLIALGAFAISNISFVMPNTPFSSATSSILYVRTLVDFRWTCYAFLHAGKKRRTPNARRKSGHEHPLCGVSMTSIVSRLTILNSCEENFMI